MVLAELIIFFFNPPEIPTDEFSLGTRNSFTNLLRDFLRVSSRNSPRNTTRKIATWVTPRIFFCGNPGSFKISLEMCYKTPKNSQVFLQNFPQKILLLSFFLYELFLKFLQELFFSRLFFFFVNPCRNSRRNLLKKLWRDSFCISWRNR